MVNGPPGTSYCCFSRSSVSLPVMTHTPCHHNCWNTSWHSAHHAATSPDAAAHHRVLLSDSRVDPNLRERRGHGAPHGACLRVHVQAVIRLLLLENSRVIADVVVDDEGRTPFGDAQRKDRTQVLKALEGHSLNLTSAIATGGAKFSFISHIHFFYLAKNCCTAFVVLSDRSSRSHPGRTLHA